MDQSEKFEKISKSYLTFQLGCELFASHVSNVNNIVEVHKMTKIPKSPGYMKGVINLRGMVLPVIDLRIKFGMTETEVTKNTCILVAEIIEKNELFHVGVLVDSVNDVIEIKENQIQHPPQAGKNKTTKYIKGITRYNEDFIIILNMELILNQDVIQNITDTTIKRKNQNKRK